MKKTVYLILSLLMCATARTGLCADQAGTGAAAFLRLPVDARSAGMGEAVAGMAGGPMALFQNPAGLAAASTATFAFSHALLMENISFDVLGAAVPLREKGVLGLGAQSLRFGSFASLDNTGAAAGSLSPRDTSFSAGYAVNLDEDMFAGAAVKYISSKISGSAATAALDAGLVMRGERIATGFTLQNIGSGLKFNKESSPLPRNLKIGVCVPYGEDWRWAADLNLPNDGPAWLAAGGEYTFRLKDAWTLFGRAGYNTAAADTKGVNGLSAGFGLSRKNLTFDYAFRTMGLLGSTHHLSLTLRLAQ